VLTGRHNVTPLHHTRWGIWAECGTKGLARGDLRPPPPPGVPGDAV